VAAKAVWWSVAAHRFRLARLSNAEARHRPHGARLGIGTKCCLAHSRDQRHEQACAFAQVAGTRRGLGEMLASDNTRDSLVHGSRYRFARGTVISDAAHCRCGRGPVTTRGAEFRMPLR
jgi:hypothetical protein